MHEDFERCYRAVQSKDARFDGWFVTAVRTTKIYCRPSCPVRPPFARNVQFYPTAAAAQHAGFRACKRCRPDVSPGSPEWNVRGDVVARAMRLIADGTVDREGVAIRTGHHCAQPVMDRFGIPATARASFSLYNNLDDVEALARALDRVRALMG